MLSPSNRFRGLGDDPAKAALHVVAWERRERSTDKMLLGIGVVLLLLFGVSAETIGADLSGKPTWIVIGVAAFAWWMRSRSVKARIAEQSEWWQHFNSSQPPEVVEAYGREHQRLREVA